MRTRSWPLALFLTLITACGDDGGGGASGDAGSERDASAYVCDPVGSNPAQSTIFNAPVANGVEVVEKVPQHPGNPGPTDLP